MHALACGLSGFFFLALLYVYHATALSMVAIWARSETFAHGFLILPISLWLIYIRWDEIATVRPQPNLILSALLLPVGLVWLVAAVVDVQVLQQLALVAMVIVGTWSVLGIRLGRMLAFPLLFLFLCRAYGRGPDCAHDGVHSDVNSLADRKDRHPGLSGGPAFYTALGALVCGGSVQWSALHHCISNSGNPLRVSHLPQHVASCAVRSCVCHCSRIRQQCARLYHSHAGPSK